MPHVITIAFSVIAGLSVLWAISMGVISHLRWRRASRAFHQTVAQVGREQALLSEGLVPEFAIPGDIEDLKRRYLAGENIPLRWRNPGR